MQSFFKAVALIAVVGILILVYYVIKHAVIKNRRKKASANIRKKRYEDEKNYLRQHLMQLLPQLEDGTLHWLLINSRLAPQIKVEITFNSIQGKLEILSHSREITAEEKTNFSKLGVQDYRRNHDKNIFFIQLNAKITVDCIYYLFEKIHGLIRCVNINLKTSGE